MNLISKIFLPITAPIQFIQRNFKTVLFLTILFYVANSTDTKSLEQPNLQIIELNGPIMIADEVLEKISIAATDPLIKGVLFKVNSPGGAVAPSVEIAYAIKELNQNKPVVAYASGIMASGSYYASIWATKIVANPGSMIGSIGVILQSVDASELMSKIGVKTQTVKVGSFKEVGTPTREWTKTEKGELQKITQNTYDMFVDDVSTARQLKKEDHKNFADAHIFTASGAKEVGLVDSVATITTAKILLINLSKVEKPIWSKEDKMEKFMQKMLNGTIANISNSMSGLIAY
ncbi:MAG: signal peptide peptidase SppA [Epsilonproteobacteria bacterium]|nr:MAG: signal peptide peptidase SppA [Campylobacterota bacterium]